MRTRRRSLAPSLAAAAIGVAGLLALYFGRPTHPDSPKEETTVSKTEPARTPDLVKASAEKPPVPPTPAPVPVKTPEPAPAPQLKPADRPRSIIPPNLEVVKVKSVTDGDTVVLEDGRKVRYLGIDTPEHDEKFFAEAKQLNSFLVLGKPVFLEFDVEKEDNPKYKRTLAYLYVREENGEEKFVNAELVRSGLARVYTFPPNVKHTEAIVACQREAIDAARGQWKDYVFNSEPYFVGTARSERYHRPNSVCLKDARTLVKYADAREALKAGKSPCRTCKP